jgi:ABC-2 type transport system permease protein
MFSRELRDLWVGGKALHLILIYSVLLGIYSFLLASNAEVNMLPLKEMILEMVKASIAASLLISLIIGADSFSGERERATLEAILLTPTSRRQIVAGKLLAAVSPWPVALAISIPYWVVLSKGDEVLRQALLWGPLVGSILAPALAGLGMIVSIWSNTNKTSMLVSLGSYLLLLLPTEQMAGPAKIQRTTDQWFRAEFLDWVNPVAATSRFLFKILVNNLPPAELWFWFTMPVLFAVCVLVLLFAYASPGLRLDAGTASRFQSYWGRCRRVVGLSVQR